MPEKATLDSWKEIARYLRRTEKTCRLWELHLGLPVHRLDGSPKARVFAYIEELDRWKEEKLREGEKRWNIGLIAGLAALGIILVAGGLILIRPRPGRASPIASIAVLPFKDLSPAKDKDYLAEGMAETLINALSNLKSLRVPARTSAFSFKGREAEVREIGQKLKVETLLEGTVQAAEGRIRVTANLIKISDGFHLWSQTYDRNVDDIFAIQDDIAQSVVNALKIRLLGGQGQALVKGSTANSEAYDQYLRGRYLLTVRGRGGAERAIQYCQKAIELSPGYAQAYSGLADCYISLAYSDYSPPGEDALRAKAAALEAVRLDEPLAEAHTSLAMILAYHDHDFAESENEFRKAIELNPGYAKAHHWYTFLLNILGRFKEARREVSLARELDPLSRRIVTSFADTFYYQRQYDRALEEIQKAAELFPESYLNHQYLSFVLTAMGRYEEAIRAELRVCELDRTSPDFDPGLAYIYALSGNQAEAQKRLAKIVEYSKKTYVSPVRIAWIYGALGDKDQAFAWLEKAVAENNARLIFLYEPQFDPLRSDPRFTSLRRRMGLEK
jgi:adenylate cyclase